MDGEHSKWFFYSVYFNPNSVEELGSDDFIAFCVFGRNIEVDIRIIGAFELIAVN